MRLLKNNDQGFSLVELVIVIAIMAVLVAALAPMFFRYIEKSKQGKDADTIGVVQRAIMVGMVDASIPDRPQLFSGNMSLLDDSTRPVFVSAIKEYIGNYDFDDFKEENIKSNAYKSSPIYVDIDAQSNLVRVTLSSNIVGVDDIVVE